MSGDYVSLLTELSKFRPLTDAESAKLERALVDLDRKQRRLKFVRPIAFKGASPVKFEV